MHRRKPLAHYGRLDGETLPLLMPSPQLPRKFRGAGPAEVMELAVENHAEVMELVVENHTELPLPHDAARGVETGTARLGSEETGLEARTAGDPLSGEEGLLELRAFRRDPPGATGVVGAEPKQEAEKSGLQPSLGKARKSDRIYSWGDGIMQSHLYTKEELGTDDNNELRMTQDFDQFLWKHNPELAGTHPAPAPARNQAQGKNYETPKGAESQTLTKDTKYNLPSTSSPQIRATPSAKSPPKTPGRSPSASSPHIRATTPAKSPHKTPSRSPSRLTNKPQSPSPSRTPHKTPTKSPSRPGSKKSGKAASKKFKAGSKSPGIPPLGDIPRFGKRKPGSGAAGAPVPPALDTEPYTVDTPRLDEFKATFKIDL